MALNPAVKTGSLNNPTERANELNDPQFSNQQGYFPYDLTHQSFLTPLFGNITPSMNIDTVPGDRVVIHDNTKLLLNRINGNFLSNLNMYVDSFYVPMRSVYPMNYEKMIVNPVKGEDLPNSALPQFPLGAFVMDYLFNDVDIYSYYNSDDEEFPFTMFDVARVIEDGDISAFDAPELLGIYLARLTLLATVFSRGQLFDYFDLGLDVDATSSTTYNSKFQDDIDRYFEELYKARESYSFSNGIGSFTLSLIEDRLNITDEGKVFETKDLSEWRQALSDIMERGELINLLRINNYSDINTLISRANTLLDDFRTLFAVGRVREDELERYLTDIDESSSPFASGQFINIGKVLAYQQVVAQYFTNDSIDNIFNSDLYMQLIRSVMYPSINNVTQEPTFDFNGVPTEYDYISVGGIFNSLINNLTPGHLNRQYVWMTLMFLLRRSLRYGDYFATARPNMLAVGQLGVSVDNGMVSPIDITKNLLMQRYLNASNYVGNGFLQYMASMLGITPSDTGTFPRFISHRKVEIQNQVTNNTADLQGAQTTNLVAYSDNSAMDVFIDDYGYLISVITFDVLPVYVSGVDSTWHFSDRFDLFNPMLQGIGDQPIRSSELLGNPNFYSDTFGYTMRNSEYKYKLSKAHGAFVNNDLPGYMMKYPISLVDGTISLQYDLNINPDFIRDKAVYLDRVIPSNSGFSPAQYFQFVVSCTNQVHAARKIQATPPVLF